MDATETKIFFAVLTWFLIASGLVVIFCVMIFRYQKRKVALYKKNLRADMNALEQERSRIANDLHDDLGGMLSAIKIKLQNFENLSPEDQETADFLQDYVDTGMQKLRQISYNLMPQVLKEKGLCEALYELSDTLFLKTDVRINLIVETEPPNTQSQIHIYRIVQEVFNNVLRHANSSRVNVSLKKAKQLYLLQIRDNGVGFNKILARKNGKGQGLQNIMSRVDYLNGNMYLETAPGKGTEYLIEIPAHESTSNLSSDR